MKLPRFFATTNKAKLGKHTLAVKHIMRSAHRTDTVHHRKNPRKRFIVKVHKIALRNFWGGRGSGRAAVHHRKAKAPKVATKSSVARTPRKPKVAK